MDEAFMREYFEKNQEMLYTRFRKNEVKCNLEKKRCGEVESFKDKYVNGNNAEEEDFESMINAIWDDDYEAHRLMFLYGAEEREKMLR